MAAQGSTIRLPSGLDWLRGRIAVCHEIGHFLIHSRGEEIDLFTSRLASSPEEEALSEYASRLLLMPAPYVDRHPAGNLIVDCMTLARSADVTLHAAAARLGDPDSPLAGLVRGVILWRTKKPGDKPELPRRLTPQWHLCRESFVPVGRCHAGRTSLVAALAASDEAQAVGSCIEQVEIGALKGEFRVDAVAWGSMERGTRLVLSAFVLPQ